jgi:hypothetical protein
VRRRSQRNQTSTATDKTPLSTTAPGRLLAVGHGSLLGESVRGKVPRSFQHATLKLTCASEAWMLVLCS